jgi:hypothetical protein
MIPSFMSRKSRRSSVGRPKRLRKVDEGVDERVRLATYLGLERQGSPAGEERIEQPAVARLRWRVDLLGDHRPLGAELQLLRHVGRKDLGVTQRPQHVLVARDHRHADGESAHTLLELEKLAVGGVRASGGIGIEEADRCLVGRGSVRCHAGYVLSKLHSGRQSFGVHDTEDRVGCVGKEDAARGRRRTTFSG